MKHKIAVVLDILKDVLPSGVPEALHKLKEMGCSGVEIGGYYGYPALELARLLQNAGLKTVAMHRSLEDFLDFERLKIAMDEGDLFHTDHLVFPYVLEENRTEAGYARLREQLKAASVQMAERGFRLSYHNHDFELLNIVKGMKALDFMIGTVEDHFMYAELDTYWLAKGGCDPLEFMRKYPNRIRNLHMKDMTADERKTYAELGTGTIDFPPIISWGEQNGVQWYVIEQDIIIGDPWKSVKTSLDYLLGLKTLS